MQTEGARDRTNNLLIDLLTYSYAAIPTELPEIWISCIPLFVVFLHQPYAQHLLQEKQRQQKSTNCVVPKTPEEECHSESGRTKGQEEDFL